MLGGRVKFPDDPDIRVRLSDNFGAELRRRNPEEVAETLATLTGGIRLHPSSITRYAQGTSAPKLAVARNLAKALDWPEIEAVAGYCERYAPPTLDWGRVLLYARHFRQRAVAFLELFRSIVTSNAHFGFPNDRNRGWRRQLRPAAGDTGYACFQLILDEAVEPGQTLELVLSYCLFERPKIFIDFGIITVSANEIRCVETWTRRTDRAVLEQNRKDFHVATWIDGKVVDFVVRSDRPFEVKGMILETMCRANRASMVRFRPGPIHRYELAEQADAESAG